MKKIIGIIIAAVFITSIAAYKLIPNKDIRSIALTADTYIVCVNDTMDEDPPEMTSDDVEAISQTLSGEYSAKKEKKDILGLWDYSVCPGDKLEGSDRIVWENPLYILNEKTIAYWDEGANAYWIGRKKGVPIDIELISRFVPGGDIKVNAPGASK